jgi:hypothetical protein
MQHKGRQPRGGFPCFLLYLLVKLVKRRKCILTFRLVGSLDPPEGNPSRKPLPSAAQYHF